MEITQQGNSVLINGVRDLDLRETLDCGQSFRWVEREDGSFHGVAFNKAVDVSLKGDILKIDNCTQEDFKNIWENYFDLTLDYGKIRDDISQIHPILKEAASYAPGIRILRQEPFEALCTFIISQNNMVQ